jgi:ribose transport system substrate-binding protein
MVQELNVALGRKPGIRNIIAQRTPKRLKLVRIRSNPVITARRLIFAVILALLLVAGAMVIVIPQRNAAIPPVRIIPGEHGTITNVTPTQQEIDAARSRLGDSGFIAYLACELDSFSQVRRAREMGDMAAAQNLGYEFYDAENDASVQVTQIEQARLDGARAIILCPVQQDVLSDSITSLQEANIPLAYITMFDHPYGVKQDSNSYEIGLFVGRLAAQNFMEDGFENARVVVLANPGSAAADSRDDGMETGFRESIPDATFTGRVSGNTQDVSYESIRQLIEDGVEFNVILALNDAGAYGAIEALREANYDPASVIIVSANGESYAQELIREGEFLRGTVTLNREQSSQIAIDATIKMLAGSPVPEIITYAPGEILTREVLEARGD